jgi:hypothetical protein
VLRQRWQVDGSNGENRLLAIGESQAEAWYRARVQARELGSIPGLRDMQPIEAAAKFRASCA